MNLKRFSCVVVIIICAPCYGQDRGRLGYTNEELMGMCTQRIERGILLPSPDYQVYAPPYSPVAYARDLGEAFEIVVDGEFQDIPEKSGDGIEDLNPKDVLVRFKVMEVYKGSEAGSIGVSLNSDMLEFPGGEMSRYAARNEARRALRMQLQPAWEELDALRAAFDAGEISRHLFSSERRRLEELIRHKSRLHPEFSARLILRVHGETFYSRGGAIQENERYLVGFDRVPGETGVYRLEEDPEDPNIFWGEQREDVILALRSPEDFRLATPYGAYDPTEDQDCETLRDLLGPSVEATPRDLAMELLDAHEVVAYGEFVEISDASPEELRRLESKEVRVQFRVQGLYIGDVADLIEVELNTDMLFVPGEDRSRYSKRQEMREQALAYLTPHLERVREMRRSVAIGNLDRQVYQDERDRVMELQIRYGRKSGLSDLMSAREVSSWLGDTFYERGGVIHPYRSYLIGVNKKSETEDVYLLGELPESPSRIYCGEESDLVLRELEELAP